MAPGLRNHSAARPDTERTAGCCCNRPVIECRRRGAVAMPAIETRGLRKTFGKTVALDGVDLRVEEGRILGIVGPNGAGKSTALHAILGLTSYQGELRV